MNIAIVVQGRFQDFDLARELIKWGHKVTLFTNYPKWAARHFGISPSNVQSFWLHGVLSRLIWFLNEKFKFPYPEAYFHKIFGRWAANQLKKGQWDVIQCRSGVSEELLYRLCRAKALKVLLRGSSHISTQARLLEEEKKRANVPIRLPSSWMIAREKREYEMADYIRVLSKFAYQSFVEEGISERKLILVPSGVSVMDFKPSSSVAEQRQRRIMRGEPLRILYVGAISFQKGILDMAAIVDRLQRHRFHFRLVGTVEKEAKEFIARFANHVEFISKQPQHQLYKWYAWADLFVFPTIQDGYAVVLAQAQASGLPIISTTNCAGPDIIVEDKTGWVLPIRNPEVFAQRLLWCDLHREELAQMTEDVYKNFSPQDWSDVARNFAKVCSKVLNKDVTEKPI